MEADDTGDTPALGAERRSRVLAAVRLRGTVRVSDLAAELGVTPVTIRRDLADLDAAGLVSRVHGGAIITPDRPDGSAPRTANRTNLPADTLIGLLVPSLTIYWPDIARSVEGALREAGLRLLLRGSSYEATDERPDLDWLVEAGCAGLLAAPSMGGVAGERTRQWLEEAPIPVVLLERTAVVDQHRRAIESVISDHTLGGEMAAHHLAHLGHQRISAVLAETPHTEEIRFGWERATSALGKVEAAPVQVVPDRHSPDAASAMAAALDRLVEQGVTGVLVHSDPEAVRLAQLATTRRIRIPQDLSVISYDDEIAALASPPLTALRPPRQEVGRTAVAVLLERLADPGRAAHRVAVSPTLVARDSTAPPLRR